MSIKCSVNVCGAVALPFNCDFETDAICEMQLSTASNLDWTRRIGRASEQNTGPPGAQSGSYYMLVDASMDAAAGDRAMLVIITQYHRLYALPFVTYHWLTFVQRQI